MASLKFQKNKEDFVCEKCGVSALGSGYTNHCPACLWSKHVDIMPGDRLADCGGLMEPVFVEHERQEYILTHNCLKCGHKKRNKINDNDNFDVVVALAKKLAGKR